MSGLNVKKKILLSFLTVTVAFLLVFGAFSLFSANLDKIMYDEIPRGNAIFPYDANYQENIFADEEYTKLDRLVCYTDVLTGVTLSIDDDSYSTYNDLVVFMYEYIRSIIYGDSIFYNDCYSDRFIAVEGEQHPFTMQKLYDIEFGVMSKDQETTDGVLSKVWLDYKIFKNNVTLRTDIGSDVNRRQYLTLIREGENYKIISVSYVKVDPIKRFNLWRTVAALAGFFVLLIGTAVGSVVMFKKVILTSKVQKNRTKAIKEIEASEKSTSEEK